MGKTKFKVYATRLAPGYFKFQSREPKDTATAALRLRTMAQRLKPTTPNPTPANGEADDR